MIHLIQEAYSQLHSLWHAHGCGPGMLEWEEIDGELRPFSPYRYAFIVKLADEIRTQTGSYPSPCHLCRPYTPKPGGAS